MTLFLMIVAGLFLGVAGTVLAYRPLLRRYRLEQQNMQQYAEQLQSDPRAFADAVAAGIASANAARGTGIGLSIVQEYIAAHGGQLSLLPNHPGAHFRIELPHAI